MNQTSTRYALLDELRGLDLISMMLYHGTWDAVYLFGVAVPWYAGTPGRLWQQSICWGFILLSGLCLPMGHHPVKRGAAVFGAGALVTAVTLLFMPENVVLFGVLTLLGSAMILTGLLEKALQKVPPVAGFLVSFALFALITRWTATGALGHCAGCCRGACTQTSLQPIWAFTPSAFSPPITSRFCRGCFYSGRDSTFTISSGGSGWNRCAGCAARRWGGWGGTRWCCTCSISRSFSE